MSHRVLELGVVLVLSGCAAEADPAPLDSGRPMLDAQTSTGVDASQPSEPDAAAPAVDAWVPPGETTPPEGAAERLVGTFAMRSRYATIQTLPFLGDQRSVARAYARVSIEPAEGALRFTEEGCRVEIEGGGTTMTTIPDAIPRSIAPQVATLEFREEGGEWHWTRPMIETLVGWRASGASDGLPMEATDPRVIDQDEDGQPGVTVHVSGFASGDVYVVQRQRGWYTGPLGESGDIEGVNHAEGSEQRTVGASTMLLDMDIPSRPDSDARDNVIRMVRVDEAYDCARIVAEAEELFR